MKGKLYLVATPIGNLEDITLRAIRILKEADLIVAEDTRHTLQLLNHLEITKTMISYQRHSNDKRKQEIIEKLLEGKDIALVTDAGTPGISDPGEEIVEEAIKNDIKVVIGEYFCMSPNLVGSQRISLSENNWKYHNRNDINWQQLVNYFHLNHFLSEYSDSKR